MAIVANSLTSAAKYRVNAAKPNEIEVQDGPGQHWHFHSAWATPGWAAHMVRRFGASQAQTQEAVTP